MSISGNTHAFRGGLTWIGCWVAMANFPMFSGPGFVRFPAFVDLLALVDRLIQTRLMRLLTHDDKDNPLDEELAVSTSDEGP